MQHGACKTPHTHTHWKLGSWLVCLCWCCCCLRKSTLITWIQNCKKVARGVTTCGWCFGWCGCMCGSEHCPRNLCWKIVVLNVDIVHFKYWHAQAKPYYLKLAQPTNTAGNVRQGDADGRPLYGPWLTRAEWRSVGRTVELDMAESIKLLNESPSGLNIPTRTNCYFDAGVQGIYVPRITVTHAWDW